MKDVQRVERQRFNGRFRLGALVVTTAHAEPAPSVSSPPEPWPDSLEMGHTLGSGTLALCEAAALPLKLVPNMERRHGTHRGGLWQASLALGLSKLWRQASWLAVLAGVAVAGAVLVAGAMLAASVVTVAVWPFAAFYAPVAVTGVLAAAGMTYMLLRYLRKAVGSLIFRRVYGALTPGFKDAKEQQRSQRTSLIRPLLNVVERAWLLAAVAGGTDAEADPVHVVPVVGPLLKSYHHAQALKADVRRLSAQDFQDGRTSFVAVDAVIHALTGAEGVMGMAAHVGFGLGAAVFISGTLATAYQLQSNQDVRSGVVYATVVGIAGLVGMTLAAGALGLLLLREVPKALEYALIPMAYGVGMDGAWFPARPAAEPWQAAATLQVPREARAASGRRGSPTVGVVSLCFELRSRFSSGLRRR